MLRGGSRTVITFIATFVRSILPSVSLVRSGSLLVRRMLRGLLAPLGAREPIGLVVALPAVALAVLAVLLMAVSLRGRGDGLLNSGKLTSTQCSDILNHVESYS